VEGIGRSTTTKKLKGPKVTLHFRPMPFQQRTNTSCYLIEIPTHGFTVVLSVFGGTPLLKPLNCKICFLCRAAMNRSRAHDTGDQPMLVFAKINLSSADITWMSFYVCSRSLMPLVNCPSRLRLRGEIKNPAYFRKQGWWKI
jgi:hypothetical protein